MHLFIFKFLKVSELNILETTLLYASCLVMIGGFLSILNKPTKF